MLKRRMETALLLHEDGTRQCVKPRHLERVVKDHIAADPDRRFTVFRAHRTPVSYGPPAARPVATTTAPAAEINQAEGEGRRNEGMAPQLTAARSSLKYATSGVAQDPFAGVPDLGAATHQPFAGAPGPDAAPTLERLEESSVVVSGMSLTGRRARGTGVVIGDDLVLTANHVAKCAGMPKTLAADEARDVAVVEQNTAGAPALQLATAPPAVGDTVYILSDLVGGARPAHVTETGEQVHLDVPVPDGTSGGAVANSRGKIVSMVTHGDDDAGTCHGPSAPAIRETIAVPDGEHTPGQPIPGQLVPEAVEEIGPVSSGRSI